MEKDEFQQRDDVFFVYLFHRTVLLRLASIAVLMITLYVEVEVRCNDNPVTCCQQVRHLVGASTGLLTGMHQQGCS